MDDSEVVTFGLQSADKEAVEDTLQESIVKLRFYFAIYFDFFSRTFDPRSMTIVHVISE
jgi:hypothetical protein